MIRRKTYWKRRPSQPLSGAELKAHVERVQSEKEAREREERAEEAETEAETEI